MIKRNTYSLSVRHYAILFLLLAAAFFLSVGYFTLSSLKQTRLEIDVQNQRSAQKELKSAILKLTNNAFQLAHNISSWDEIFQQLESSSYYAYWRKYRLLHNGVLPDYINAAEIFDSKGYALANLSDTQFPYKIDITALKPMIDLQNEDGTLILYLPIQRDRNSQIKGYLGVNIPFLSTLIASAQLHFVENITLPQIKNRIVTLDTIASIISYKVKSNPEADKMMAVVKASAVQIASIVGIFCLILYFFLVYLLGKPLVEISEYIDKLRNSNYEYLDDHLHTINHISELENIKDSLDQYHSDLELAQLHLDDKNQELWELAHHDSLTSVLNRRAFDNVLYKSQKMLRNKRLNIGLILFDVNRFKAINDSYGHQVGDEVLKAISACLQKALRKGDNLYRIGGDEFATIIIGNVSEEKMILANRCVEYVNNFLFSDLGIKENVSVSCGISSCQANELESISLLQRQADIAVYQAKRPSGVNPVLFHPRMVDGSESVFSSWMSDAVNEAVTNGTGIEMHYQPIVDNVTKKTKYYESLIRIQHDKEWIPPSHIFPIIALRQLESELDRQVIKKVEQDLQQNHIGKGLGVTVNLSADSIVHKDLLEWLQPLTAFTQSHHMIIEVTETSLITQLNAASSNLISLRKLGFKIALDDFGSGYSSLRYLTSMPVDIIKFDIALIQGMLDKRLGALVNEMARMLHKLGYELVAEGIETEELLEKVNNAGFNFSQGFLLGKPTRKN